MEQKKCKKNEIIKSQRTFGLEFEVGNQDSSANNILNNLRSIGTITRDSSITAPNGVEFVTKKLKGLDGSQKVRDLCQQLRDYNFITDDVSCSLHLHLDGAEFLNQDSFLYIGENIEGYLKVKSKGVKAVYKIEPRLFHPKGIVKNIGTESIKLISKKLPKSNSGEIYDFSLPYHHEYLNGLMIKKTIGDIPLYLYSTVDYYDMEIEKIKREQSSSHLNNYYSQKGMNSSILKEKKEEVNKKYRERIEQLQKCKKSYYVVSIENHTIVEKIKSLLYFYIGFNNLLHGMVEESRRANNSYCMPLTDFFTIADVDAIESYTDFEKLWYKENNPEVLKRLQENHYNDSRYLDINLHSLFNRTKTVEIRLHGSTKDENQVLLWVAFHQLIIDSIAKNKIGVAEIKKAIEGNLTIEDKYYNLVNLLQMPEYLADYVRRALNHFSNLNIK